MAKALRRLVEEEGRDFEVRRYIEALTKMPETGAEVEFVDRLGAEALEAVPWSED